MILHFDENDRVSEGVRIWCADCGEEKPCPCDVTQDETGENHYGSDEGSDDMAVLQ